jgi:glyoxylase-like metal-dependent hydrolase (beta-lactamase superfamily II)
MNTSDNSKERKLIINSYVVGPVQSNAYLTADIDSGTAVVIDPGWDGELLIAEAEKLGVKITDVWLSHAHFDHIGGLAALVKGLSPAPNIALHPDDLELFSLQGGAPLFGMKIDTPPMPDVSLFHGQNLTAGNFSFEVRYTPGHTKGHVVFYCETEAVAFVGDVIFWGSIGRTDLPGGNYSTLIESINNHILTMPDQTRLLTGHGPETNVGFERVNNPFLME